MSDLLWPLRIYQSIPSNWQSPLISVMDLDGVLHFWTPGVLHGRSEIGYYAHDLGRARVLAFRDLIERNKLWDSPGITVLEPEQAHLNIIAGEWEGPRRSVLWPFDSLPPAVLPVMDAFHKLLLEAYASPKEVLAGEARWSSPSFSARDLLRFEFTLRNRGSEAISLDNPMVQHRHMEPVYLLISQGDEDGELSSPHRIALPPTSLSRLDPPHGAASSPPSKRLHLAPGESVRFAGVASAFLSPAEHRAVISLDTGSDTEKSSGHVGGVLAIDMPPLRIVHR